ncbi:MAG TPA: AarF/ABC1/UbiB kinase family protein, partial [Polyangiaceae bacterium]|nr:AarF/ABC1/UbiB kinase family protein [Polyangiaceae bacterium]
MDGWLVFLLVAVLLGAVAVLVLLLPGKGMATTRVGRISSLARLWTRFATSWLGARVRRWFASPERRARIASQQRKASAELVAHEMGQMKGALMKIGQMVSFVSDEVPEEYREALSSLQTAAPPMDFTLIRDVIERELGRPLERAFAELDTKPLAAASIGQVHRARLPSGEEVVVKVQYPGVAEAIRADLNNADLLYSMLSMLYASLDPKPIVEELRARIGEELDYGSEAANQRAFQLIYANHPFIRIPRVVSDYSTPRVLTSEFIAGKRLADLKTEEPARRARYGEILYRFVFGSIFRFGVFNGDPHPGNYLFDAEGRMAFLDFGCVKYFPVPMLERWRRFVKAHLEGDAQRFYDLTVEFGFIKPDAGVTPQLLYRYFDYFYAPFQADRVFRFDRKYTAQSVRVVFRPEGEFAGIQAKLNMPRDFVFANRLQWGVYSVLAELGAEENFHRIHREFIYDEPPATELGEQERRYWREFRAEHGLPLSGDLLLRPSGVMP